MQALGKHHGSYEVEVQAAWRGNRGEAVTGYHVRALPEHDLA